MMADVRDILTLNEAKAALNIDLTVSSVDTELAQVITAASEFVDGVYGPVVWRTVTDERHVGAGTSVSLRYSPVASVTSVTEYAGGVAAVLTAETDLVPGGYSVDLDGGVVYRRSSWNGYRFGAQSVLVTYVAGRYATTEVVAPWAKEAAAEAVIHFWQARGANSGFGTVDGDGAPFGGVPFSTSTLRKRLIDAFPQHATLPGFA
jgi:hypothetical protein